MAKTAEEKIRPRHKVALEKILENLGQSGYETEAEILEKLGYSPGYAKGAEIKKTKSWKALSDIILPDWLLADRNKWLLMHPNYQAVAAGLDKAYRAKKKYGNGVEIINKYSGKSREELEELVARRVTKLLGRNR